MAKRKQHQITPLSEINWIQASDASHLDYPRLTFGNLSINANLREWQDIYVDHPMIAQGLLTQRIIGIQCIVI